MAKSPYQKGRTRLHANLDERLIRINGAIAAQADNADEILREIDRLRRGLVGVFNPFDTLTLEIYGNEYRRMFPDIQAVEGPMFDDQDYTLPDGILYFSVSAVVPGNLMEDIDGETFHLMEVVPSFHFPLVLKPTIIFGNMTFGGAAFNNMGDVETPILVEIPGYVETPRITNETTGEYIQVHTPILANETMYINTAFGRKTVIIRDEDGNERNAFHYIDLSSRFFSLSPGISYLRFSAEVGNDTANVKVSFKNKYLGL